MLHTRTWGHSSLPRSAVLLHGITSNAGSWIGVGPALVRQGYHCVAPDLLGHGESPKPDHGYELSALVDQVAESAPQAPDLLVGHSLGGLLALLAALDGALGPRAVVVEDPTHCMPSKELPARLLGDVRQLPREPEALLAANPSWTPQDAAERARALDALDWRHMERIFVDNAPWDVRPRLAELSGLVPVLYLVPEPSEWVSQQDLVQVRAALGGDAVVVLPDVGHSIHRDDLNIFMTTMLRWLDGA